MTRLVEGATLFVIDIEYIVPLDQVDPHLDAHLDFVNRCYDDGCFLASGPKNPRSGGIILATAASKEAIENLIKEDPFHAHQLADFTITEFMARRVA